MGEPSGTILELGGGALSLFELRTTRDLFGLLLHDLNEESGKYPKNLRN